MMRRRHGHLRHRSADAHVQHQANILQMTGQWLTNLRCDLLIFGQLFHQRGEFHCEPFIS